MAIGERIKFFRKKKGLTQKQLGLLMGSPDNSADIRIAQYENGSRHPRSALVKKLANILDVSPRALDVPDIDSPEGVMHMLFTLEDLYGLQIIEAEGEPVIIVPASSEKEKAQRFAFLREWAEQVAKYEAGEISKAEYDQWRYCFSANNVT